MIKKQWNLESYHRPFEESTLMLQITHYNARVFLGHKHSLAQMEDIHIELTDRLEYSDNEGGAKQGSRFIRNGAENNHVKEHMEAVFLNEVIDKIKFWDSQNMFTQLKLFVPKNMKKELEHKLPKHLWSKTEFIMGTFNYESPHQLVDRLYILK